MMGKNHCPEVISVSCTFSVIATIRRLMICGTRARASDISLVLGKRVSLVHSGPLRTSLSSWRAYDSKTPLTVKAR
jgi:hypothetical protein